MERVRALPLEATWDSGEDESALVEAARSDPSAFDPLYQRYLTPIYRYLRVRVRDAEDAADLTQQVFLKVFEALPHHEDRGLPFGAWVFRVAHNAVVDASRTTHPSLPLDELPEAREPMFPDQPELAALAADALASFRQLIAPLDVERRDLLTLRFVAELPTAEIAVVLGKRDDAVRAQLSRALATLKEIHHG